MASTVLRVDNITQVTDLAMATAQVAPLQRLVCCFYVCQCDML